MRFTFENQGTNTYLVYEIGANDELDTMSLGMLTNNSIPGFAAASFTQMDTTKFIKYNVSAKVSVAQLFSGAVNKKRLVGVFSGIVNAMLSAEDYMLDTNNLLLDLNYIFADVSTCETVVVCLPVMNGEYKNPELGMFFKNIIFNTQFDQTENCDHVAQILNYLNSNPALALADFKELLERIGKTNAPAKPAQPKPVVSEPAWAATPAPVTQQPVVSPTAPANAAGRQTQPTVNKKFDNLQFGVNYAPAGQTAAPAKAERNNLPDAPHVQEEKPMSMFYLLQHYNKENAAIYKAQQEAKKAKKGGAVPPAAQPVQPKTPTKHPNTGFAIPGKEECVSPAFAVPGQQAAVPAQKPVQPAAKMGKQPAVPKQQPAPVYQQPAPAYQQPAPAYQQPAPAYQQPAPAYQQPAPAYQQPVQASRPINFGETTVLGGGIGETTVLSAAAEPKRGVDPHLIRVKNNEKISLNKPVFRIGKERSYVDYFVSDNTAISRSHANIINHNGEFFIVDTNSTNHTYVDGSMISSNVETKLSHGTKIRLANEDFEFRMY